MTLLPAALPQITATLAQVTTSNAPGAPGASTTTFPLVPPEPAASATGSIVFGIVVLIIATGALVLYLRHRTPTRGGSSSPTPGAPPDPS